jgi:hypothetical protein
MMPSAPASTGLPPAEAHAMELECEYPSGARQWRCPVCARRTVLQYPGPQQRFKIVVLAAGDERVAHVAAPAGFRLSSTPPAEIDEPPRGLLH